MTSMNQSILLIVPGYPSATNRYNNAFVHTRLIAYKEQGLQVRVFSVDKPKQHYVLDEIEVTVGSVSDLVRHLKTESYATILIHFAIRSITEALLGLKLKTPVVIWVHGYEALHWKRRLFFFNWISIPKLLGYALVNTVQRKAFSKFVKAYSGPLRLVFVSEWMKSVCAEDTWIDLDHVETQIIPNVIDTDRFVYQPKSSDQRLHVLSIRPYANRKYANDLSVAAIVQLSKMPQFKDFTFSFYGNGRLFNSTTAPLKGFPNVYIHRGFLNHEAMADVHKTHGVMLIPTRQDSQGVTMGEAMSSGLVPITSLNTAIPEFVDDNCGFLTTSVAEMVQALLVLHRDEERFKRMSEAAAIRVRKQCDKNTIIASELSAILVWSSL